MVAPTIETTTLVDDPKTVAVSVVIPTGGDADVSATAIIDVSALTPAATQLKINKVQYSLEGFTALLAFDATTDSKAMLLAGSGCIDLSNIGSPGLDDPQASGYTGDLMLSTNGLGATNEGGMVVVECEKVT